MGSAPSNTSLNWQNTSMPGPIAACRMSTIDSPVFSSAAAAFGKRARSFDRKSAIDPGAADSGRGRHTITI